MNHHVTQGVRGPRARIGRRVAAIVAECNYAQTRRTSLRPVTQAMAGTGEVRTPRCARGRSDSR